MSEAQFLRIPLLGLGEYDKEKEVAEMQDPPSIDDVLKELDVAEELVNTFAVRAKRYWMGWGPVAMPMILTIEAWAPGAASVPQMAASWGPRAIRGSDPLCLSIWNNRTVNSL